MSYKNPKVAEVAKTLIARLAKTDDKASVLRAVELKALYAEIPTLEAKDRAAYGQELNQLKAELEQLVAEHKDKADELAPIDVTAPFDVNTPADKRPKILTANNGSKHPLM